MEQNTKMEKMKKLVFIGKAAAGKTELISAFITKQPLSEKARRKATSQAEWSPIVDKYTECLDTGGGQYSDAKTREKLGSLIAQKNAIGGVVIVISIDLRDHNAVGQAKSTPKSRLESEAKELVSFVLDHILPSIPICIAWNKWDLQGTKDALNPKDHENLKGIIDGLRSGRSPVIQHEFCHLETSAFWADNLRSQFEKFLTIVEVTDKEYAEKLRKDLNCLASNGIVKLANGERKMIKQLKIGDQVMTVKNESGMTTFSPVTDIKFHQESLVLQLWLEGINKPISLTHHHVILVSTKNDLNFEKQLSSNWSQSNWVIAKDVRVGNYLFWKDDNQSDFSLRKVINVVESIEEVAFVLTSEDTIVVNDVAVSCHTENHQLGRLWWGNWFFPIRLLAYSLPETWYKKIASPIHSVVSYLPTWN